MALKDLTVEQRKRVRELERLAYLWEANYCEVAFPERGSNA